MRRRARLIAAVLALLSRGPPGATRPLLAQGATTSAITGVVRDERGAAIANAEVEVVNRPTGFALRARTHDDGRYAVFGLEVGGPYSVAARRIGYERVARDGIFLTLGHTLRVDLILGERAVLLAGVTAAADGGGSRRGTYAVGTLLGDSLVHRLPIANRDLYGLVKLVPQMTTWYGLSAAGASPRVNAIMIDGASEQGLYGGNAAAGIWGGKAISLEAIREYQVVLSPFDVRHGNFAGALINAVTRGGGNDTHGSVFYYGRYGALSRNVPFLRDAYYRRDQSGFSIGGPLARDRANFLVVAELQRLSFPTIGAYVGQPAGATPSLQVHPDSLARFASILAQQGMVAGSPGPITAGNPLVNVFARVDVSLPAINSRLMLRENFSRADSSAFSRPSPPPTPNCRSLVCFPLSSLQRRQVVWKDGSVAQLLTSFRGGSYNEAVLGRLTTVGHIAPVVRQPLVIVQMGQSSFGQTLQAGSYEAAQGDLTDNRSVELTDNFTLVRGAHTVTIGGTAQLFRVRRLDMRGAFGVWTFGSLDAFAAGQPQTYRIARDFGGGDVHLSGAQVGAYAGDSWDVTPRLTLTYGLRADIPTLSGRPPYSPKVDTLFGRRTDVVPTGRVQWSPRLGFTLVQDGGRARITGGVGVFMGRPPLSWITNAYANYGAPRMLVCGAAIAPPFTASVDAAPSACANGQGLTADSVGAVNLLDPRLAFPQNARASLAVERQLPWAVTARLEGQYTRALHELFFVNRNLAAPAGTDGRGRVMYGAIGANGRATVARARPSFGGDVIELTNQSLDYSSSVTGALEKRFAAGLSAAASFSYSRAYDVQSHRFTRSPATDNWRFGRVFAGRQDVPTLGISDFDQPYRVVVSGTYAFGRAAATDISLYYVGASGFPYTYLAGGDQLTGDLNADGTPLDDPIYVPRDVNDPAEIVLDSTDFAPGAQRQALERFIRATPCLRSQRGRILRRNSCRSPWTNTLNLAVRQAIPGASGAVAEVQLFNALNLLNRRWGRVAFPAGLAAPGAQVNLLTHTRQTSGSPAQSMFEFDPATRRFDASNVDSYYQVQLGVRYSF